MNITRMLFFIGCLLVATHVAEAQEQKTDVSSEAQRAWQIRNGKYKQVSEEIKAAYFAEQAVALRLLSEARKSFRKGSYADAINQYQRIPAPQWRSKRWELAEVYAHAGNAPKALELYRRALYQKVQFAPRNGSGFYGHTVSPRFVLPGDAVSVEDAKARYGESEVEVWADNDAWVVGHFALLLAQNNENAEAIGAYEHALQSSLGGISKEWIPALSLGNISATNFNCARFQAAVYTMMAAKGYSIPWEQFVRDKTTGDDSLKDRYKCIDEALRIKPDYAPAYFIKADMILTVGDRKTEAEYRVAKQCLENAARFARSNELRESIEKLRHEESDKLR